MASASRAIDWGRRARAGHDGRPRLRQPDRAGRIPAGLSQRIRPLHRPSAARSGRRRGPRSLPPAEDDPARRDLGRNGTYLVFRELQQDVRGLLALRRPRRPGDGRRRGDAGGGDGGTAHVRRSRWRPQRARRSAAWVPTPSRYRAATSSPMTTIRTVCAARSVRISAAPIRAPATCRAAARVWIARLMRMLGLGGRTCSEDLIAASRFHRILRRGREYGRSPSTGRRRCAATRRTRAARPALHLPQRQHRAPVRVHPERVAGECQVRRHDAARPIRCIGNREPLPTGSRTDGFSSRAERRHARADRADCREFVTVRGGAYFFLPGLAGAALSRRVPAAGSAGSDACASPGSRRPPSRRSCRPRWR